MLKNRSPDENKPACSQKYPQYPGESTVDEIAEIISYWRWRIRCLPPFILK